MAPEADEEHQRTVDGAPTGRSVYDDPPPRPGRRRVLDGAAFGLYEDDDAERRVPVVAVAVVAALAVVVSGLVVWAVQADDDLELPAEEAPTTTSAAVSLGPPSTADLLLLVPPTIEGCQPLEDPGTGGPQRAMVRCPGPGGLGSVELSLYPSVVDRDDAFDFVAGVLGAGDDGECALGRFGRHDYIGVRQVGQVACGPTDGRTDLVWTSDVAPLLAVARGEGSFATVYEAWARLVDRTDAAFPTGPERVFLDQLPSSLLDGCERDVDGALSAGAELAVTCRPDRSPAEAVSWLRFGDRPAASAWLEDRRAGIPGAVADGPEACTRDGFGQPEAGVDDVPETTADPAPPVAGRAAYDFDGRTGDALCHLDAAGRATIVWVRDGDPIGTVAVAADGVAMAELLTWWEAGGHLP